MTSPGLRVAIVCDALPGRNGVGTYYADLADHLARSGVEAHLIMPRPAADAPRAWLSLPMPGDATQRVEIPSPVGLRRRLRALAPDTVVAPTPGPFGLLGARYARAAGARLVVGMHTQLEALAELYWGAVMGRINRWGLTRLHRRLCHDANCVVTNAPAMAEEARRAGARDDRVVGTLLPSEFLEPVDRPNDGPLRRLVFVGRLAAEKRVDAIIAAAEARPGITFAIAGDGPLRGQVERAAGALPNLEYCGWLDRGRIRQAIDDADGLVLPSSVEAFGTVALEALARGRPAVVSHACGIRDWSALGAALWPIGADEDLTAAVDRLAAIEPALRRAQAERGRAAVAELTTATRDQWLEVLAPAGTAQAA